MKTKVCSKCGRRKYTEHFYAYAQSFSSRCKNCMKEHVAAQTASGYFKKDKRPNYNKPQRKVLSPEERRASRLYFNILKRTRMRELEMTLTLDQVKRMVTAFCHNNYYELDSKSPFRPSIDRIDVTKGYTESNCRVMWVIENYARHVFTDEQVMEFCKRKIKARKLKPRK